MKTIMYQQELHIDTLEFKELLIRSTLAERRPVEDVDRLEKMIAHSNLIITARVECTLVGIARSITDFYYCTYLSDLAVDVDNQNMGIGRELIRKTKLAVPKTRLILLSAPKAIHYYPKIGMTRHGHCYMLDEGENV